MYNTDEKIAHLGFIQGVINRMANNSFLIKGWCVTLVAAVLSLASSESDKNYFFIAFIPIFIFWGMDAYFFYQEHLYRKLYEDVTSKEPTIPVFSLNANSFKKKLDHGSCYLFKIAVFPIYLSLGGVILLVILKILKIHSN